MTEEAKDALLRAETEFVVDPQRRPIEYWHRQHTSGKLPLAFVRKRAAEHRWMERRHAFWAGVQRSWLRQAHVQLVQQRSSELNETLDLRERVYQLISPKKGADGVERFPIQPKSWEGMIKAFAVLDTMAESKRQLIMGAVDPMLSKVEETDDGKVGGLPFSPDEMRSLAHGLLAKRRAKRRANLGIEDEDDIDDTEDTGNPIAGSGEG